MGYRFPPRTDRFLGQAACYHGVTKRGKEMSAMDKYIEIYEGHLGGDNTNILPVRMCDGPPIYEEKKDETISVCCYYLAGYFRELLIKYYDADIQPDEYRTYYGYEEYGWTFYTPQQVASLLTDLEAYIAPKDADDPMIDFYRRLIIRMRRMLENMDGYDLILFCGP